MKRAHGPLVTLLLDGQVAIQDRLPFLAEFIPASFVLHQEPGTHLGQLLGVRIRLQPDQGLALHPQRSVRLPGPGHVGILLTRLPGSAVVELRSSVGQMWVSAIEGCLVEGILQVTGGFLVTRSSSGAFHFFE